MRSGAEWVYPLGAEGDAWVAFVYVYRERMLEIASHLPGLPDLRTMTIDEIDFFYEGLIPTLKAAAAPRKK